MNHHTTTKANFTAACDSAQSMADKYQVVVSVMYDGEDDNYVVTDDPDNFPELPISTTKAPA